MHLGSDAMAGAMGKERAIACLRDDPARCIIDGMTFASAAERAYAQGLADAFGVRCVQIAVVASQRLAIERVRHQPHSSKERGPALVRRVAARFAPLDSGVLQLDGRDAVDQQLQQALVFIAGGGTAGRDTS